MKKSLLYVFITLAIGSFFLFNTNRVGAAKPSGYGLKEGDLISAIFSDDPDVYIINDSGYKRLFLNPEIFKFYGHLGGFFNIKLVTPEVRDSFATSGLFRNCEDNDQKVYGVDIEGEDSGQLHWVNTSGAQAVADDANFFKKVFCINNAEFNWYPKGSTMNTVKDVPKYERMSTNVTTTPAGTVTANSVVKNVGQVVICHYPPEAPNKFQDITIDASALKAHIEHGDVVGACPSVPQIGCTTEAKFCPDGSYVSRSGPNCEFSMCPVPKPTWVPIPTPASTPITTPVPTPITSTSIAVVYPNGGEVLQKGTTQIIKWNSVGISKIYIKLGKGNDTYHGPEGMITDVIANVNGYYKWTIPTTLPDGNDYYIRVVDGNYTGGYDDTDSPFSIGTTATQTPIPSAVPTPSVSAIPTSTPTPTPTPTLISCAPITVSLSPATPQLQNASPGQDGASMVIFNIATSCNLNLNSFAVSLLPMPNGYQNISSLRLYDNATGAQLGSTVTISGAGLNFTGLNQPIAASQTLFLKVVGDISPSAINGSTVYTVFGGSSATDATTGTFVGNNASGNIIAGNTITVVP